MLHTKFSFIWPGGFRGEDVFRNQPIRNKIGLWWPCLLTDRNEMNNLYRGPSIDASYQLSVHLAKEFQRRRFFKIGQSETRIACVGHVCKWIRTKRAIFREDLLQMLPTKFQRRRLKCEKLTDNRRRVPSDGRSSHCLWQSELKRGEGQVRATSACAPENELVIP